MKFIVVYQKSGALSYLGHLDFQHLWERLLRISQLPLAYSEGFHPMMKMNLIQPLSVGMDGQHEYLHLTLKNDLDREQVRNSLIGTLPDGLSITKVSETRWTAKQFHQRKATLTLTCQFKTPQAIPADISTPPILKIVALSSQEWRVELANTSQEQTNFSRLLLTRAPSVDIIKLKRVRLRYR
jgi:radical SAM-linked protein